MLSQPATVEQIPKQLQTFDKVNEYDRPVSIRVRSIFLKLCRENFCHWIIILQPYVGRMKDENF